MQVKINNKVIKNYNRVDVSLIFDAMASSFGFEVYFNPADSEDRTTYVPGNYGICEVSHNGEVLITGAIIGQGFKSSPVKHPLKIGGYSKAGVLQDSQNAATNSTQFSGMSLKEIASKLIAPFGLTLVVDSIVSKEANSPYTTSPTIDPDDSIKEMLTEMALGKNIIFSHTANGNLLLTRADAKKEPIFNFDGTQPATSMELSFDGQPMHNKLFAVGQYGLDSENTAQDREATVNPYVQSHMQLSTNSTTLGLPAVAYDTGYRPGVYLQKTGNDNNTPLTSRQYLSQELKNIRLTIEIASWTLNGKLVRPNNIVTVRNPDIFLYQKSRWFIERVDYRGEGVSETARLTCVLPECYNNDEVKNVFTGSNLTVPYREGGAKATITPFI